MKYNAKDPQTWISRDLFKSYCGDGSEKLLYFYDKAVERKNALPWSLNWLAILILPAWLGYRKQWPIFVALSVLCAALPFIEGFVGLEIPYGGLAGGIFAIGFMANGLLLMSANNRFLKLKKSGMDRSQIQNKLEDQAASSVTTAIVATAVFLLLQFLSVTIAHSIFGLPG